MFYIAYILSQIIFFFCSLDFLYENNANLWIENRASSHLQGKTTVSNVWFFEFKLIIDNFLITKYKHLDLI